MIRSDRFTRSEDERTVGVQFREIRSQLRGNGNKELEKHLVKQLKSNDQKKYWTLVNKHPAIKDALDSVLHIECLWPSFSLSNFHKTSAMKCDQLVVNYIRHIKAIWEYILYNSRLINLMDFNSLKVLELTCPKISTVDAQQVKRDLTKHLDRDLDEVVSRVFQIDTLIPTFTSLFNDLNYLEDLVAAIKQLHRPKVGERSLRDSLQHTQKGGSEEDAAWKKLFLYVMRNYYQIPVQPSRRTLLKANTPMDLANRLSGRDYAQLNHFARHAFHLGFKSCERRFQKPSNVKETHWTCDVNLDRNPILTTQQVKSGVPKSRRSGKPPKDSHQEVSKFLSIENMEADSEALGVSITHFFVRKAVYRAFFNPWRPPNSRMPVHINQSSILSAGPSLTRDLISSECFPNGNVIEGDGTCDFRISDANTNIFITDDLRRSRVQDTDEHLNFSNGIEMTAPLSPDLLHGDRDDHDCTFELKIRKSSNVTQGPGGMKRSRPLDCSQRPDQGLVFCLRPFAKRQRSATQSYHPSFSFEIE